MPKIRFLTSQEYSWMEEPQSSLKFAPTWYKHLAQHIVPDAEEIKQGETIMGTAKICSPFQDALGAGYIIPLPSKLTVVCEEVGTVSISWGSPVFSNFAPFIDKHSTEQLKGMGLEEGGVFKFNLPWAIELEEGYSALFTHPLNRPDLPFQTFSGVVDCDTYHSPVNIPFIWTGPVGTQVLDAGTPVVQIIPFKREEWTHQKDYSLNTSELYRDSNTATSQVLGYKRKYRTPKAFR